MTTREALALELAEAYCAERDAASRNVRAFRRRGLSVEKRKRVRCESNDAYRVAADRLREAEKRFRERGKA